MTRIGRRSGRTRGSELGLETIVNRDLGVTKRVTALLSGTTTAAPASLEFTQGQTGMATVDIVIVTLASQIAAAVATGSLTFAAGKIAGGTVTIRESTETLNRTLRLFVQITGRPDPLRTATVPQ